MEFTGPLQDDRRSDLDEAALFKLSQIHSLEDQVVSRHLERGSDDIENLPRNGRDLPFGNSLSLPPVLFPVIPLETNTFQDLRMPYTDMHSRSGFLDDGCKAGHSVIADLIQGIQQGWMLFHEPIRT